MLADADRRFKSYPVEFWSDTSGKDEGESEWQKKKKTRSTSSSVDPGNAVCKGCNL